MKVKICTAIILMIFTISLQALPILPKSEHALKEPAAMSPDSMARLSADSGIQVDMQSYLIIQKPDAGIPSRGTHLLSILSSNGILCDLVNVNEVIAEPEILIGVPAIVMDSSVGSDNGAGVSDSFISLLKYCDTPLVLVGRAAWLLHRLRDTAVPTRTAPLHNILRSTQDFEGAVFLSYPHSLTMDASVTTEEGLELPVEHPQSPSLILNLTGSASPAAHSVLRYTSWPADVFLFGPENYEELNENGKGLLVNTVAFATSLRESPISSTLRDSQANDILSGGLRYLHEPTLSSTYYAVKSKRCVLNTSTWSSWKTEHQAMIADLLGTLIVDLGSKSGFYESATEGIHDLVTTSRGVWIVAIMDLESQFNVTEFTSYISSEQLANGSFNNRMDHTFFAIEALYEAGQLSQIDTTSLESWLRDCVIGSESHPDHWGGIGKNPDTLEHWNLYAFQYVLALDMLGKEHDDTVKLTQRIQSTANGDGSYNDTVGDMRYHGPVLGTTSALTAMAVMDTLSTQNKTSGIGWFSANQLDSGGFGMYTNPVDIVGKTRFTSYVAESLYHMGETTGVLASGIETYVASIEHEIGFEGMELLPSLMWTSWLSKASRYAHAGGYVDYTALNEYLQNYAGSYSQYPSWPNLTLILPPEYDYLDANIQYRLESVWAQYFGASMAQYIGLNISSLQRSFISGYIKNSQDFSGHFRPTTSMLGTAHMQYSVAAVEALYLLDSLDEIMWRSLLDSAILSEYSSGQWSSSGWTLKPFAGQQSAIDYLSTRAALRMGLVTSTMAEEIESTINARIQYTDLWALSRDVATMSLLNTLGFSLDHDLDRAQVINALGSDSFPDGWYNSTSLYQPIFTADVLEMISILGLRPQLSKANGTAIEGSVQPMAYTGEDVNIDVTINSTLNTHTIFVTAFNQCLQYDNVANSDTLVIPIPTDCELGANKISLMVLDYGNSRGFNIIPIEVWSALEGSLVVDNVWVLQGDLIIGTVSWSRSGGEDAGTAHIVTKLDGEEWNYDDVSPFTFSLPSDGLSEGKYNLTVNLTRSYCDKLLLWEEITVAEPEPTYITSPSSIESQVNQEISIPWSLHFQNNDSYITGQNVSLEIRDSSQTVAYSDWQISIADTQEFYWTPTQRNDYSFKLVFNLNGTLENSESSGTIHVYEITTLDWVLSSQYNQYDSVSFSALLTTESLQPLSGETITVLITSPSLQTVIDSEYITNSSGYIEVFLTLQENGVYILEAAFLGTQYLNESESIEPLTSWSASSLSLGGIDETGLVTEMWDIWARLTDSDSYPVSGQQVNLTITYLPSTIVKRQTLTTNTTGYVSLQWQASSVGQYRVDVKYGGTLTRGAAYDTQDTELRASVALTISHSVNPEVGVECWICVLAEDDFGPLSGLDVWISVKDPLEQPILQMSGTTSDGLYNISWTPSVRGWNNISALSDEQSWYDASSVSTPAGVYEQPSITIELPDTFAPELGVVTVSVLDSSQIGISDASVSLTVLLNSEIILDSQNTTDDSGMILQTIYLGEPGQLTVIVYMDAQGWLLNTNYQDSSVILGDTEIDLNLTGFPVDQGTSMGIVATLVTWDDTPLQNSNVTITVLWPNGTIIDSAELNTTSSGTCVLYHEFNIVGDFNITADYEGELLHSAVAVSKIQRVYVTPNLYNTHEMTVLVGQSVDFSLWLCDVFGTFIEDRILNLTISMYGEIVYSVEVISDYAPVQTLWTPMDRGIATVSVSYVGDRLYLSNTTESSISIMDSVDGAIELGPSIIDLYQNTTISYTISMDSDPSNIPVIFEVLGVDLVKVWEGQAITNGSGTAEITYIANHTYGQLTVKARPSQDEFLSGGDTDTELTVMTDCHIDCELVPAPPVLDSELNITIEGTDDLDNSIDNLDIKVYLYDPSGDPVKLGSFYNYVSRTLENGITQVSFTPVLTGFYTVEVKCSGTSLVHSFEAQFQRIVYCPTIISVSVNSTEINVMDAVEVSIELLDINQDPLESKSVTLTLDGPNSYDIGPIELTTDSEGKAFWEGMIEEVGLWVVEVEFGGLGVYLADESSVDIDAIFGTRLGIAVIDAGEIIAGLNPVVLTVYLEDSASNPLEGRTISYEVYHDIFGLVKKNTIMMISQRPESLNVTMANMGNHTIVFSYNGTVHYKPSNTAIRVWVRGTIGLEITCPILLDRSENITLSIMVLDEIENALQLDTLELDIQLNGPEGTVNLTDILSYQDTILSISLLGLKVGNYTLNATVLESVERLGSKSIVKFSITSQSSITVESDNLSCIVGEEHSITLVLLDSIDERIYDATIYISLYDPTGKEIYGAFFNERTPVYAPEGSIEIAWVPNRYGIFRLVAEFENIPFIEGCNTTLETRVRYTTHMIVISENTLTYPEVLTITLSLDSPVEKVSASVNITVFNANGTIRWSTHSTDSRGKAQVSIKHILAGFHEIHLNYSGSEKFHPCSIITNVTVCPTVEITGDWYSSTYVYQSYSAKIIPIVKGVSEDWVGTVIIQYLAPDGAGGEWLFTTNDAVLITLVPEVTGNHSLVVMIDYIPVLGNYTIRLDFSVSEPPPQFPMDPATAPVGFTGIVVIALSVLVRKKMGGWLGSLSGEWEE